MIHHIQIIGEASGKLTPAFRKTHQQVPWPEIIKMRHVLERDLSALKNTLLKHMPKRPSKANATRHAC